MQTIRRLAEVTQLKRRSIADALEVLRCDANFTDSDIATVEIAGLRLPSGEFVGLIELHFEQPSHDTLVIVSLPTSARYSARTLGAERKKVSNIARLHGAVAADDGTVRLSDGQLLSAVEVIPAQLPREPSELDWKILRRAIAELGLEEQCYRSLAYGIPPELQILVPNLKAIDCSTLPGQKLPMFKVLAGKIAANLPNVKRVPSNQQIANSLRKFGFRIPRARPRKPSKKRRSVSATIRFA